MTQIMNLVSKYEYEEEQRSAITPEKVKEQIDRAMNHREMDVTDQKINNVIDPNILSLMGASPNTIKITQTAGMKKCKACELNTLLSKAQIGDLTTLPVQFKAYPDVFSILMAETKNALMDKKQPFSYFDLTNKDSVAADVQSDCPLYVRISHI